MKYNFNYTKMNDRDKVLNYLKQKSYNRVLDVGYSVVTWSSEYVTHYCDINPAFNSNKHFFNGDINMPFVWDEIDRDVKQNGKFDFIICTHTLEDIINPLFVCLMMEKYSNQGYIAVPSKYMEFSKHQGNYYGYIHHRYIYNKENGQFVAYPKVNFLEYDNRFLKFNSELNVLNEELQFFWEENISLKIINDNYLGPDIQSVIGYYDTLLNS